MGKLLRDVQYAVRQFRRNPGFAITAVLTLALGLGATTAIFTLIYNTMLKPLPVKNAAQLVMVGKEPKCCNYGGLQGDDWGIFSNDLYLYFRAHTQGFESLTAFEASGTPLLTRRVGDAEPPVTLRGRFVAGNEFSTLGVPLALGRPLQPSDDTEAAPPVAVISYRTWQRRFGLDPRILGATFSMNNVVVTVAGVTAPGYHGEIVEADPPELWLALTQEAKFVGADAAHTHQPDTHWLDVVGRLAPGANAKQVTAQLNVELRQWLRSRDTLDAATRAQIDRQATHLTPVKTGVNNIAANYGQGLKLLMWAAGFVLLIVCANVANLLLVRATAEKQQQAVRIALGATRGQLVRQAIVSSALLALAGGAGAVLIASAVAQSVLRLAFRGSNYVPVNGTPSAPVLGFAVLAALVTAVLCAVVPAWLSTKTDPASVIRGGSRTMKDSGSTVQRVLVVTQAALSVVLLCAAGLLLRSLDNLQKQDFGFVTRDRYIVGIDPFLAGYKPEQLNDLYRKLHERLMQIPGAKKAAFALYTPLSGDNWNGGIYIPGQPGWRPDSDWYVASYIRISPEYFDAIGAKLHAGRFFTDDDNGSTRHVAIVNQNFADRYFHGNALGKHFGVERELSSQFEIVGIVENTKHQDPAMPPPPMYYLPFAQTTQMAKENDKPGEAMGHYAGQVVLWVQGGTPATVEAEARRAFTDVNPLLTPQSFHTFAYQVSTNFNQDELLTRLTSLFGLTALILASIGLYGVTAYSVQQRTGEIGVRMALGADRADILRDVLKRALAQCGLGLAIGVPLAYGAGRLMAQKLFGVGAFSFEVAGVVLGMLMLAATVAALVPARRAASIEPMVALRLE